MVVPIVQKDNLSQEMQSRGRSSGYLDKVMKLNESGDTRKPITHIGVQMTVYRDDEQLLREEESRIDGARYCFGPWEIALNQIGLKVAARG